MLKIVAFGQLFPTFNSCWIFPLWPSPIKPYRLVSIKLTTGIARLKHLTLQFSSLSARGIKSPLSSRKAIILTTGIHGVFRGLKFEPDAEIGQKGAFCKGLSKNLALTTSYLML